MASSTASGRLGLRARVRTDRPPQIANSEARLPTAAALLQTVTASKLKSSKVKPLKPIGLYPTLPLSNWAQAHARLVEDEFSPSENGVKAALRAGFDSLPPARQAYAKEEYEIKEFISNQYTADLPAVRRLGDELRARMDAVKVRFGAVADVRERAHLAQCIAQYETTLQRVEHEFDTIDHGRMQETQRYSEHADAYAVTYANRRAWEAKARRPQEAVGLDVVEEELIRDREQDALKGNTEARATLDAAIGQIRNEKAIKEASETIRAACVRADKTLGELESSDEFKVRLFNHMTEVEAALAAFSAKTSEAQPLDAWHTLVQLHRKHAKLAIGLGRTAVERIEARSAAAANVKAFRDRATDQVKKNLDEFVDLELPLLVMETSVLDLTRGELGVEAAALKKELKKFKALAKMQALAPMHGLRTRVDAATAEVDRHKPA